jgi:thioredoxin reductase
MVVPEVMVMNQRYDVVVIGGGAAGLNGALMLARSRRSVLVIDAGEPRNAPAGGVHGLLGREGMSPSALLAVGRDEVRSYGGQVEVGTVDQVSGSSGDFLVSLTDGRTIGTRRLLLTTGLVDELPNVPGLRARWGRDVLHCPYCHGWEVRDQAIGVLAGSARSVHQALLFRQLSDDVVYFANGLPISADDRLALAARDISVVDGVVDGVETIHDRLSAVRLVGGTTVPRQALAVSTRMVARADFLSGIGLRAVEHPSGAGAHVPVDALGRTEVPGVWAAGNVSDPFAQVGAAAAAGAFAGAQINADLVTEEARSAVESLQAPA